MKNKLLFRTGKSGCDIHLGFPEIECLTKYSRGALSHHTANSFPNSNNFFFGCFTLEMMKKMYRELGLRHAPLFFGTRISQETYVVHITREAHGHMIHAAKYFPNFFF